MVANDEVPLPNRLTSLYAGVSPDSTAGLAGGVTVGWRKVALGVAPRGRHPAESPIYNTAVNFNRRQSGQVQLLP